jgi:hypothetical protein
MSYDEKYNRANYPEGYTSVSETDPDGKDPHAGGAKLDFGKPRVGLMFQDFPRALLAVAAVTTYGAKKYTESGWLAVDNALDRYEDAKGRHLLQGHIEQRDADSEHYHLSMEAWNALAVLELYLRGTEENG